MKKFILIALLICSPALANDMFLVSKTAVKSVLVNNDKILTAKPLQTINNDKKIIILTPKADGKTELIINTESSTQKIKIFVKQNNIDIEKTNDFEIYGIDIPPEDFDIPNPPKMKAGK